jgi:hypothetical protein
MKKTGLLLLVMLAVGTALAQTPDAPSAAPQSAAGEAQASAVTQPVEHLQAPTYADQYCAGFVSKQLLPNASYVAGGLHSPNTTKFVNGDAIYLAGSGYQKGQQFTIVRELQDPNRYESFPGQAALLKQTGQAYAELGRVKIVDVRSKMAIAEVEYSCEPMVPGDIVTPFEAKPTITMRQPARFDRFAPPSGKPTGRIVMARDFDALIGTGAKVYLNMGSNQGLKPGDFLRAMRPYTDDFKDPVDSLSFKAALAEDTQRKTPTMDASLMDRQYGSKGPKIHVQDFPTRSVGEMVILSVTPTTATAMVTFALEDIHAGDQVEVEQQ